MLETELPTFAKPPHLGAFPRFHRPFDASADVTDTRNEWRGGQVVEASVLLVEQVDPGKQGPAIIAEGARKVVAGPEGNRSWAGHRSPVGTNKYTAKSRSSGNGRPRGPA